MKRTGRTAHSVNNRRRKLGLTGPCLHKNKPKPWDDEQRQSLYWLTLTTTRRKAALIMDRSVSSIRMETKRLGMRFRYKEDPRQPGGEVRVWSKREKSRMWWEGENFTAAQLGERLGRSESGVRNKAESIGLRLGCRNYTLAELSRDLGVSLNVVSRIASRNLGLTLRRKKGEVDLRENEIAQITMIVKKRLLDPNYIRQYKPKRIPVPVA